MGTDDTVVYMPHVIDSSLRPVCIGISAMVFVLAMCLSAMVFFGCPVLWAISVFFIGWCIYAPMMRECVRVLSKSEPGRLSRAIWSLSWTACLFLCDGITGLLFRLIGGVI